MKPFLFILALQLATGLFAQVAIAPREDSQKAALQLNNAVGKLNDAPFKLELDILNAFALKAGQAAILVVPVHSLKSRIETADDGDLIPAGQLWLHQVVPDHDGKPAAKDRLRLVEASEAGGEARIAMFHLAIQMRDSQSELLVYGIGPEPLINLPLRKMTVPQEAPIELDGKKRDETSGELSIYLGDHFEARMIVRARSSSE